MRASFSIRLFAAFIIHNCQSGSKFFTLHSSLFTFFCIFAAWKREITLLTCSADFAFSGWLSCIVLVCAVSGDVRCGSTNWWHGHSFFYILLCACDFYHSVLQVIYPFCLSYSATDCFSVVQSLSHVQLFATPWIAARQASLSITNSRSSPKLMSIESVMPSSHLILCRPLLLLPPIPPSIRVFSSESTLRIRWPKYWSFSFNISPSNEHPGLISFRMDWLDLLAVQGTLKSLLQQHSPCLRTLLFHL